MKKDSIIKVYLAFCVLILLGIGMFCAIYIKKTFFQSDEVFFLPPAREHSRRYDISADEFGDLPSVPESIDQFTDYAEDLLDWIRNEYPDAVLTGYSVDCRRATDYITAATGIAAEFVASNIESDISDKEKKWGYENVAIWLGINADPLEVSTLDATTIPDPITDFVNLNKISNWPIDCSEALFIAKDILSSTGQIFSFRTRTYCSPGIYPNPYWIVVVNSYSNVPERISAHIDPATGEVMYYIVNKEPKRAVEGGTRMKGS